MRSAESNPRILVVGAGPAGLATGHFLKERGYTKVTILEKLGRVGGMCSSFTKGYQSFDMGANYVTSSYKEVERLAREVGADMYTEGQLNTYNIKTHKFDSMRRSVLANQSIWVLAWQSMRFLWLRWRLYGVLSPARPGFAGLGHHPELYESFGSWLEDNKLGSLRKALEIPITLFSYGKLNELPAVYALTYMTLGTFMNLAWIMTGLPRRWPKRMTLGFQRLWERVAWGLDVQLETHISSIERGEQIKVTYTSTSQVFDKIGQTSQVAEFDKLILACPLTIDVLEKLLGAGLSEEERVLSEQISLHPCVIAAYETSDLECASAITYMVPLPPPEWPSVVARQYEHNDLVVFFTPYTTRETKKSDLLANMRATARDMGGDLAAEYVAYDEWPYFPHVETEQLKAGYYQRFENLQGVNNTYYCNGLLSFELVESVTAYAKQLVNRQFPDRTNQRFRRWVVWVLVATAVASGAALLAKFSGHEGML